MRASSVAVGKGVVGVGIGGDSVSLGVGCTGACVLTGTQLTLKTSNRLTKQKAKRRWLSHELLIGVLMFIISILKYMASCRPLDWMISNHLNTLFQ